MAAARKAQKKNPTLEAAVEYFAARSHDAWRRRLLQTKPQQKGKPRMRLRGGVMVDVNQPWAKLDPRAKADNKRAARDAYRAVQKFPHDREAAADYVHQCWVKRSKGDASQPTALFKPYARLSEVEKDKDRAHVEAMTKAIAAVRSRVVKKATRKTTAKRAAAGRTVKIDAESWRRLEAAAKQLSAALGRDVSVDVLASAGVSAIAGVCKAIAAKARAKRS